MIKHRHYDRWTRVDPGRPLAVVPSNVVDGDPAHRGPPRSPPAPMHGGPCSAAPKRRAPGRPPQGALASWRPADSDHARPCADDADQSRSGHGGQEPPQPGVLQPPGGDEFGIACGDSEGGAGADHPTGEWVRRMCQSKVVIDTKIMTATRAAIGITATTSPRATRRMSRKTPTMIHGRGLPAH